MGLNDLLTIKPLPVPGVNQPTTPVVQRPAVTSPVLPTAHITPPTATTQADPLAAHLAAQTLNLPKPTVPKFPGSSTVPMLQDLAKWKTAMFKKGSAVMDHFTSLGGNPTYTGPRIAAGGNRILQVADTQLGVPYVFGALDPAGGGSSAIDCSGLTKYVFSKVGITLPHSAAEQSQMFPKVGQSGLKPGDLVFYDYGRLGGASDHVAIYAGNGMQVAASSSAGRVELQPVDWSNFIWGGSVPTGGRTSGSKPNTTRRQPKPTVSRAETNARRGRQT